MLLDGACDPRRLLALARDFIVFEDDASGALVKKMAGYHQFHAVQTAVAETLRAAALQQAMADNDAHGHPDSDRQPGGARGDRRIGVVWHTQGSGKSLTMAFYAGRIVREPEMANPTVVVLTDRNDLDDNVHASSRACVRPASPAGRCRRERADLRGQARRGPARVFAIIQKFFPMRKGRPAIAAVEPAQHVVDSPDAGARQPVRTSSRLAARHLRERLANARSFGLPEHPRVRRRRTCAVFGDHIQCHDIQRAVDDWRPSRLYSERRLAALTRETERRRSTRFEG